MAFSLATIAFAALNHDDRKWYRRHVRSSMRTESRDMQQCCNMAMRVVLARRSSRRTTMEVMRRWWRAIAVVNGHTNCVRVIQYIDGGQSAGDGSTEDQCLCTVAARHGHLHTLQYLHTAGFPWNAMTTAAAAGNGELRCLAYAREHGCEWNSYTTSSAAYNGQIACLRYAVENGCEWDLITVIAAVDSEQRDCIDYMIALIRSPMNRPWFQFTRAYMRHNLDQNDGRPAAERD